MQKAVVHPDVGYAAPQAGTYYSVKNESYPAPSTYRGRKRRSCNPCCCCLAWLCSIIVLFIAIVGVAALVFWLVVRPKAPHYNVYDVRITGLEPNAMNASLITGTLNVETSYIVLSRNPNKKIGIHYDEIKVNVETLGVTIGNGMVSPFYQGHKNTTFISGNLNSGPLNLYDVTEAGVLTASAAGKVPLYLTVDVRSSVKVGSWESPRFTVNVRCNIVLNPSSTTASQILDKSCSVKTAR